MASSTDPGKGLLQNSAGKAATAASVASFIYILAIYYSTKAEINVGFSVVGLLSSLYLMKRFQSLSEIFIPLCIDCLSS